MLRMMDKLFWSSSGVGRVSRRRRTTAALGWFGENVERAGEHERGGGSDAACSSRLRGEKRGLVDAWNVEGVAVSLLWPPCLQRPAWRRGEVEDKASGGWAEATGE